MTLREIPSFKATVATWDANGDNVVSRQELRAQGGGLELGDTMRAMGPVERYRTFLQLDTRASREFLEQGNTAGCRLYQRLTSYSNRQMRQYETFISKQFSELDPGDQNILITGLQRHYATRSRELLASLRQHQAPLPFTATPIPSEPEALRAVLAKLDTGPEKKGFFPWLLGLFGLAPKADDQRLHKNEVQQHLAVLDESFAKLSAEDRVGLFMRMSPAGQRLYLTHTSDHIATFLAKIDDMSRKDFKQPPPAVFADFARLSPEQQEVVLLYMEHNHNPQFVTKLQTIAKPLALPHDPNNPTAPSLVAPKATMSRADAAVLDVLTDEHEPGSA